jgi:hypothetical protein
VIVRSDRGHRFLRLRSVAALGADLGGTDPRVWELSERLSFQDPRAGGSAQRLPGQALVELEAGVRLGSIIPGGRSPGGGDRGWAWRRTEGYENLPYRLPTVSRPPVLFTS